MVVFENVNGKERLRQTALEELKRTVVQDMGEQCKEWLSPSLHVIVDNTKQKVGSVKDRTADKEKGEDVFNDVENMFAIFFPNQNIQVNNHQLETCYESLRNAISRYNDIRKTKSGIYKSYMTVAFTDFSNKGENYKKDYNIARFTFIKKLLKRVFRYSLVAWSNSRRINLCCELLTNVLCEEDRILLFCSDIYAFDVALQKQKGKNKNINDIHKCAFDLVSAIKDMAVAARGIYNELFEMCATDAGIGKVFELYTIDNASYDRYKSLLYTQTSHTIWCAEP